MQSEEEIQFKEMIKSMIDDAVKERIANISLELTGGSYGSSYNITLYYNKEEITSVSLPSITDMKENENYY